jgi:hypothetical protein
VGSAATARVHSTPAVWGLIIAAETGTEHVKTGSADERVTDRPGLQASSPVATAVGGGSSNWIRSGFKICSRNGADQGISSSLSTERLNLLSVRTW